MSQADDQNTPKPLRTAMQNAIAYADWILGGPAPRAGKTGVPRVSTEPPKTRVPPLFSEDVLHSPCLVYGERIFPFSGEMVLVGREPQATIRIDENLKGWETVSLCHARLQPRNGRWVVRDGYTDMEPSERGIFVNWKRTRVNYLNEQCILSFGFVAFRFYSSVARAQSAQRTGEANDIPCVQCDAINKANARFCQKCGCLLDSATLIVGHTDLIRNSR